MGQLMPWGGAPRTGGLSLGRRRGTRDWQQNGQDDPKAQVETVDEPSRLGTLACGIVVEGKEVAASLVRRSPFVRSPSRSPPQRPRYAVLSAGSSSSAGPVPSITRAP